MGRLFGAVALIVVTAVSAGAQAPGLPVINSGPSRGFTLAGMAGFGNDGAGNGTAVGVSGTVGMRRFAVGGFVSTVSAATGATGADGSYQAAGATLAVKLLGGPLVPISLNLHTGVGYSAPSYVLTGGSTVKNKTWHVPVGLGIAWVFPQPVVALKPWIAPRADVVRVSGYPAGPESRTDTNFALSGGVNLGFLNGLGVDVAFDRVFSSGVGSKPLILGLGLSYSFK